MAHRVPATLLGSMAFGGRADAGTSTKMVQEFLKRGHDELDTAFMYTDGQAETIIGQMKLPNTGMRTTCSADLMYFRVKKYIQGFLPKSKNMCKVNWRYNITHDS